MGCSAHKMCAEEATEMLPGMGPLLWRQAGSAGGVQPGVFRWHLVSAFQYLKELIKEGECDFFTWTDSDRTKGKGFKVKEDI